MTSVRTIRLFGVLLGFLALWPVSGQSQAFTIDQLNQLLESTSVSESQWLDLRREVEAELADPDALLMFSSTGHIIALDRDEIRETVGLIYDWTTVLGLEEAVIGMLPPAQQALARFGIATGLGREGAINEVISRLEVQQAALRQQHSDYLGTIDRQLEHTRQMAEMIIAMRDRLIRDRDAVAQVPGTVCFDDGVATDGFAVSWDWIYGVSPRWPVKGDYICSSWMGYIQITAGQLRTFTCDMQQRPPACEFASVQDYVEDVDPETGERLLRTGENSYVRMLGQ